MMCPPPEEKKRRPILEKFLTIILVMFELTNFMTSITAFIFMVSDNCSMPFLLSTVSNCSGNGYNANPMIKLGLILVETWIMTCTTVYSGLLVVYVFPSGILSLVLYVLELKKRIKDGFHIIESRSILMHLHVLERIFNDAFSKRSTPTIFTGILWILIGAQCTIIGFYDRIDKSMTIWMTMAIVDGYIMNFVMYSIAGWVHEWSDNLIGKWRQNGINKNPLVRRQLRSCRSLKVKFGNNFVDKGTAFVVLDFVMAQTVNILLIIRSLH